MTTVKIRNVKLPKCPQCKKFIEGNLKHPVISKVSTSSYGSDIECTYDEKVHSTVDKYKLEKELKAAVQALGYEVGY